MKKAFTEHPAAVGETYGEHLIQATRFGGRMIGGGMACVLHGVFPFLFVNTGSKEITRLHDRMVGKRCKLPEAFDFVI